jgi:hypothetical protein
MGKQMKAARQAKAEKGNYGKLVNKVRKKGMHKGRLPQSLKRGSQQKTERFGFDLTGITRPQLEKLGEDELRQMSTVRGQGGRSSKKNSLIDSLLGFKAKIQTREVRESLYAQYLVRCAQEYQGSPFAARGSVLSAIRALGVDAGDSGTGQRVQMVPGGGVRLASAAPNPR